MSLNIKTSKVSHILFTYLTYLRWSQDSDDPGSWNQVGFLYVGCSTLRWGTTWYWHVNTVSVLSQPETITILVECIPKIKRKGKVKLNNCVSTFFHHVEEWPIKQHQLAVPLLSTVTIIVQSSLANRLKARETGVIVGSDMIRSTTDDHVRTSSEDDRVLMFNWQQTVKHSPQALLTPDRLS